MKKISLEELKARSMDAAASQEMIVLVRKSKSPTAAYDLAIKEKFDVHVARECRYLAMIRRDYGIKVFEDFVTKRQENCFAVGIGHLIQTADRLGYILNFMHKREKREYVFNESDEGYLFIIGQWYNWVLCDKEGSVIKEITKRGKLNYIKEVKLLLQEVSRKEAVDKYSLSKALSLLAVIINVICSVEKMPGQQFGDLIWSRVK